MLHHTLEEWESARLGCHMPRHLRTLAHSRCRERGWNCGAQAERVKLAKYAHLNSTHFFVPFAVETSGVLGEAAEEFVRELGRRLFKITGEPRSREYLLQRISIAVQRGNAAAILGTMGRPQQDSWE